MLVLELLLVLLWLWRVVTKWKKRIGVHGSEIVVNNLVIITMLVMMVSHSRSRAHQRLRLTCLSMIVKLIELSTISSTVTTASLIELWVYLYRWCHCIELSHLGLKLLLLLLIFRPSLCSIATSSHQLLTMMLLLLLHTYDWWFEHFLVRQSSTTTINSITYSENWVRKKL